ncbi:flagellar protein FliT [Brevibacillus sp. SYSU BS000544]|uniref:flagellar protein FliT n=1 Tax=Brevibacillus sp. SYSU BS000544 TaxID=3416443 RepID=UPI003CE45979
MKTVIETLLEELLLITNLLKEKVTQDDTEPEDWLEILQQRQEIMNKIQSLLDKDNHLEPTLRNLFGEKILQLESEIKQSMDHKKQVLEKNIQKLNQTKNMNRQYGSSGYTAYGAFFDTKK